MVPDDIVERFESGRIDGATFRHVDHVRLGWTYLRRYSAPEVLQRMTAHLAGAERYHETMTWAYVLIIADRMARAPDADFEAFRAANPDLFDHEEGVLRRYYSRETLASQRAKASFVWPDQGFSTSRCDDSAP